MIPVFLILELVSICFLLYLAYRLAKLAFILTKNTLDEKEAHIKQAGTKRGK